MIPLCVAVAVSYLGGMGITFLSSAAENAKSAVDAQTVSLTPSEATYTGNPFTVSEEDAGKYTYTCTFSAMATGGSMKITLSSENETVITLEGTTIVETRALTLSPGTYQVTCVLLPSEDAVGNTAGAVAYRIIPAES